MGTVTGRVTDHTGTGVPGVWVYAYPAEGGARFGRHVGAHTDLTGRWALELPTGLWKVRETGYDTYELLVGDLAINTAESAPTSVVPTPSRAHVARLLQRRRSRRE